MYGMALLMGSISDMNRSHSCVSLTLSLCASSPAYEMSPQCAVKV